MLFGRRKVASLHNHMASSQQSSSMTQPWQSGGQGLGAQAHGPYWQLRVGPLLRVLPKKSNITATPGDWCCFLGCRQRCIARALLPPTSSKGRHYAVPSPQTAHLPSTPAPSSCCPHPPPQLAGRAAPSAAAVPSVCRRAAVPLRCLPA